MDVTRFTYVGRPAYASALAQELETQGLSVDYQPPIETKDLGTAMNAVSVVFSVTGSIGSIPVIKSAVRAFKARFAGTRVEGLPDDDGLSIPERLARVDELKADGTITEQEHAKQRAHIIGEL
jgi:hypothetical protein